MTRARKDEANLPHVAVPDVIASSGIQARAVHTVHTLDERLKKLSRLDSPGERAVSVERIVPEVTVNAAPPPAPVAAPEPAASSFIDRGAPMPEHYGLDRLAILPRDAEWLFVYWELKGGRLERLRFNHSAEIIDNSRWVLRVRTTAHGSYFVDVDLRAGQWYLKVAPDTQFMVELGFIGLPGQFEVLLAGNEVRTPRVSVSNVVDERWMVAREKLEALLQASGATTIPTAAVSSDASKVRAAVPVGVRSDLPRAAALFSGLWARREN